MISIRRFVIWFLVTYTLSESRLFVCMVTNRRQISEIWREKLIGVGETVVAAVFMWRLSARQRRRCSFGSPAGGMQWYPALIYNLRRCGIR